MPKASPRKKNTAKGSAKGKVELTLTLPDGENVVVEAKLTDNVVQLRVCVQEVLDAMEQKRREDNPDSVGTDDISEETREERSVGIELDFEGARLTDLETSIQDLGVAAGSELLLVPPSPQTGVGSFQFPNGSIYHGEWHFFDGKKFRHGLGSLTHCGESYTGNWVRDIIEGQGKYTFGNGAVYEGKFKGGKYQGTGTFTWPDGSSYSGDWESNVMEGTGTFTTAEGDKYAGKFTGNRFLTDQGHWLPVAHSVNFI